MRDITLGITFYHDFTTRAFATGIPTQLAGSPVLSVLEENNATPITAGVSVNVDRASVTGLNEATIVATGGNGYEAGKSYSIYISTGTVGGVSVVGEVVGQFTVGQSAAAVDAANATDGFGALKTLLDAIPTTAMRGTDNVVLSGPTKAEMDTGHGLLATEAKQDIIDTVADAIKAVTDKFDAAQAEPTGVPAVNETPLDKLAYVFMALRNKLDVTATKKTFYDDGGAKEWEKDLSDDGTTYAESEGNAI